MADTNKTALVDFVNLPTAAAVRESLEELGIDPQSEAGRILVKSGASTRHENRVQKAIEAAKAAVTLQVGRDNVFGRNCHVAAAAANLFADLIGVGGRYGVFGDATLRVKALRGLGKGRKQATDGDAWSAAIFSAFRRIIGETGMRFYIGLDCETNEPYAGLASYENLDGDRGGWAYFSESGVEPAWIRSIAGQAMLVLGQGQDFISMPYELTVPIEGTVAGWAAAFNAVADAKPAPDAE